MRGLQIDIVALMADEEAIRRGHELSWRPTCLPQDLLPALMEQHLDSEVRAIKFRDANASRRRFRSSIFESARRIGRGIERVGVRSSYLSQAPHSKDALPYLSREVELLTSLQILRGFNITAGGSEGIRAPARRPRCSNPMGQSEM
jgi:hypothetical protein